MTLLQLPSDPHAAPLSRSEGTGPTAAGEVGPDRGQAPRTGEAPRSGAGETAAIERLPVREARGRGQEGAGAGAGRISDPAHGHDHDHGHHHDHDHHHAGGHAHHPGHVHDDHHDHGHGGPRDGSSATAGGEPNRHGRRPQRPGPEPHRHITNTPLIGARHAKAAPPAFSVLRLSLAHRLGAAAALSVLIWLGVFWAMA